MNASWSCFPIFMNKEAHMSVGILTEATRQFERGVRLVVIAATLAGISATSSAAHANDVVMEWNQIALAATVTAGQGAVPQIRSMTIVHVSVHDAVNAVSREYKTYLNINSRWWGASAEAAAIAAAHHSLVSLFPAQTSALNAARASSLAAHGLSESDRGIKLGEVVAAAIVKRRGNDGSAQAQFPYTVPGAGTPGVWMPIGAAQALLPGWGSVTPWVLRKAATFRPDGPPSLRSRRYARDYNEVKEIGSLTSVTRTVEETEIARFWLGSPSAIWNSVARGILQAHPRDLSSTARVFALLYLTAADASIVCWDSKYAFNFWRPQNAIRQGDLDGNDRTVGDATWTPLFPTPPHPEYLSGHATNSSAMATVLRQIFGDDPGVPIVAISPTNPRFTREWASFREGLEEVIDARIFSGIHYRTADEESAHVGRAVARYVMSRELRPLKDHKW
jgi:hypothetical protein